MKKVIFPLFVFFLVNYAQSHSNKLYFLNFFGEMVCSNSHLLPTKHPTARTRISLKRESQETVEKANTKRMSYRSQEDVIRKRISQYKTYLREPASYALEIEAALSQQKKGWVNRILPSFSSTKNREAKHCHQLLQNIQKLRKKAKRMQDKRIKNANIVKNSAFFAYLGQNIEKHF